MSAAVNHVLIFDSTDETTLFFCGMKRKRHKKARIFHARAVLKKETKGIFDVSKDGKTTPWKLHLIHHGTEGGFDTGAKVTDAAKAVLRSGLHTQPSVAVLPRLRLDVCWGAIGPIKDVDDGLTQARDPKGSLLQRLSDALAKELPKGAKIVVEAVNGFLIGPWNMDPKDARSGKRMVVHYKEQLDEKGKLLPVTAMYVPPKSKTAVPLKKTTDGALLYKTKGGWKDVKPGHKFPYSWRNPSFPASPRDVLYYLSVWVNKGVRPPAYPDTTDQAKLENSADEIWKKLRKTNKRFYEELQAFPIFWERPTITGEKPFRVLKEVVGTAT